MDPLDLILGGSPDPATRAKALEFLMRQRQLGMINQYSGDKVLGPIGVRQVQGAQQGEEMQAQAGQQAAAMAQRAQQEAAMERYRQARLAQQTAKIQQEQGQWQKEYGLKVAGLGLRREALNKPEKPADSSGLRKDFQSLGTFKATQDMADAIAKIRNAPDTGAGDLSLIYSYVKILDPGSVVREGEIKLSREPTPLIAKLVTEYKKAKEGRLLHPDVRNQYKQAAESLWEAQTQRYEELATPYRRMAREAGIPEGDVVLDYGFGKKNEVSNTGETPIRKFKRVDGKLVEVK